MDLASIKAAHARVTPKSGYNLVGFDSYENDPEAAMFVLSSHPSLADAEAARVAYVASAPGAEAFVVAAP